MIILYISSLPDSDDLPNGERQTSNLRDEDGGHGFVEGSAVHVDGGTDGDDEAGHTHVDMILLLKALKSHWQGSWAENNYRVLVRSAKC